MIQHPYDDIEAFALGELDAERAEAVLDHADDCPTCAVLVGEAVQGSAALATPISPRAGVARTAFALRAPARSRAWPFAAALATAASLALLVWNVALRSSTSAIAPPPIAALVHSHFVHHPLVSATGKQSAKAIVAADGSWIFVVADQLTPELKYGVWVTADGRREELGTFAADSVGEGSVYFKLQPEKPQAIVVAPDGDDPSESAGALRWP